MGAADAELSRRVEKVVRYLDVLLRHRLLPQAYSRGPSLAPSRVDPQLALIVRSPSEMPLAASISRVRNLRVFTGKEPA
jgi:hypothetical protein